MYSNDIDKEILYWIKQLGFKWISCGKLIDHIKENYVKEQRDVIIEYIEAMEIKVPSIDILDWNKICQEDNDYEQIAKDKYLNIHRLENDSIELKRLDLIK